MPYILESQRAKINEALKDLDPKSLSDGELAYLLTKIVVDALGKSFTYSDAASVLGVLSTVNLEVYRRAVAPYEDKKCDANGDVFFSS